MIGGEIEKVLAIGEEPGPAMRRVILRIEFGDRSRSATGGGNLVEDFANARREDDDFARSPGTPAGRRSVAQGANCVCADIKRFQFAVAEEPDARTVRRPEREVSPVCAGQDAFDPGSQRAIPEVIRGAKNDGGAIGREGGRRADVTLDLKWDSGVCNYRRVNRSERFVFWTEKQQCERAKDSQGCDAPRKESTLVARKSDGRNTSRRRRIRCRDGFEFKSQIARGLPPVVRILRKASTNDMIE